MPIDNALLLNFINESLRPAGDRLAGLTPVPKMINDKGRADLIAEILGSTTSKLYRSQPWELADFAEIAAISQPITGSDSGGRSVITSLDCVKLIRILAFHEAIIAADPEAAVTIAKFAVNPRG